MTDVSAGFRPPCWCPSRWAPAWRLHTNLYNFGKNVSPHIFRKKNCCDLNLGESLCISTFFLFPDSGLNLLKGRIDFFYFDLFWIAWQRKLALKINYWVFPRDCAVVRFCYHSYDYRQNWTPLCPITITYYIPKLVRALWLVNLAGRTLLHGLLKVVP